MSEQRKYSVDEIERMRDAVRHLTTHLEVEDQLRTYMLNGTDPEELVAAGAAAYKAWSDATDHLMALEDAAAAREKGMAKA
jgi:hypothetical protein